MIKSIVKVGLLISAVIFISIQFVRPDRNNASIDPAQALESFADVPENVMEILVRSCYDCHSNQTVYPWYSNVAPFSWFLADHIRHGREEMNFSVWNTYDERKKSKKLEEICEQVSARQMSLPTYLWIHRDAILTENDVDLLCGWAKEQGQ